MIPYICSDCGRRFWLEEWFVAHRNYDGDQCEDAETDQ